MVFVELLVYLLLHLFGEVKFAEDSRLVLVEGQPVSLGKGRGDNSKPEKKKIAP